MGSCSDLEYSERIGQLAEQVGEEIAKADAVLLFGAEKDLDSLSSAACRGAKRARGFVVGVTYGKDINGGSGTLTEMAIENTGDWSERLAGTSIDQRERVRIEVASTPESAVAMAIQAANVVHRIPSLQEGIGCSEKHCIRPLLSLSLSSFYGNF